MKKRVIAAKTLIIILSLLLVWGLIWARFVTKTVRKNNSDNNLKNQHAIVKNIVVTETQNEKKYWEFYAKSGEYNSAHNSVQLNNIVGNFYDKNNEVIISFQSKKGNYDEKTKKVVLDGDNLFVGKDGSQIFADTIVWQGQDKDIIATGNVQFIQDNRIVTKAQKAVVNSALTNFKVIGKTKTELYSDNDIKKNLTQL